MRLGDGTEVPLGDPLPLGPQAAVGVAGAADIAAGPYDSCVRLSTDFVDCWGDNREGQLGNGTTTDSDMPVAVTGLL